MKYAIIAAGEGSRLAQEGINAPKPLVEVMGEQLIDRLIRIFMANEAEDIVVVCRDLPGVDKHLCLLESSGMYPLRHIVRDTPSSMHSFFELSKMIALSENEGFVMTTVDTIFREEEFADYIEKFKIESSESNILMGVTDYIDDEKPLYVRTVGNNVTGFLDKDENNECCYISGGIYGLTSGAIRTLNRCMAEGQSRMRNFQRGLLTDRLTVKAHAFSKVLDIDHATDIQKAENFLTKAYIFDYGATIDTPGNHWGMVIWHAYENAGISVSEEQYREAYVYGERTLGKGDVIKTTDTFKTTLSKKIALQLNYLIEKGYLNACEDARHKMHVLLTENLYKQTRMQIEHSRRVLQALKDRGCPLVLVSNFYGNVEAVLEEMQLRDLFVAVIESAQVGIRKPDPRIYALGVEQVKQIIGNREQGIKDHQMFSPKYITVVGDSLTKDVVPAKSLGCRAVWIKGESWKGESIDGFNPDAMITDIQELL